MHKILVSALLATPLFAFAVSTNLVANGSFESNVLGAGSWDTFTGNQVAGWNAHNQIEIRNGVAGTIGVLSKPTDERAVQTAVDYALRRRAGRPIEYAPPELQLFG